MKEKESVYIQSPMSIHKQTEKMVKGGMMCKRGMWYKHVIGINANTPPQQAESPRQATWERFSEEVSSVYDTRSVIDNEKFWFNVGVYKMITYVYVFGFPMIGVVDWETLCTIVVGGDDKRCRAVDLQLLKRLPKPDTFLNGSCKSNIFSFSNW